MRYLSVSMIGPPPLQSGDSGVTSGSRSPLHDIGDPRDAPSGCRVPGRSAVLSRENLLFPDEVSSPCLLLTVGKC